MSIGQKIIDEIIRQNMCRLSYPVLPEGSMVMLEWNPNAAEQLDALVAENQGECPCFTPKEQCP